MEAATPKEQRRVTVSAETGRGGKGRHGKVIDTAVRNGVTYHRVKHDTDGYEHWVEDRLVGDFVEHVD